MKEPNRISAASPSAAAMRASAHDQNGVFRG
jgi:hypothetical protein